MPCAADAAQEGPQLAMGEAADGSRGDAEEDDPTVLWSNHSTGRITRLFLGRVCGMRNGSGGSKQSYGRAMEDGRSRAGWFPPP